MGFLVAGYIYTIGYPPQVYLYNRVLILDPSWVVYGVRNPRW